MRPQIVIVAEISFTAFAIALQSAREVPMFTALTCMAALSFSIGGYFMKLSVGLTHLRPTLLMFGFFSVGAVLQTVAMRGHQMAITYIVVLGFEAITALGLSMVLLNETATPSKIAGVALVVGGIVLLRTGGV
jgi:multidrug transporter EmrE-like cation transporter